MDDTAPRARMMGKKAEDRFIVIPLFGLLPGGLAQCQQEITG
jgi:hypothetical protein